MSGLIPCHACGQPVTPGATCGRCGSKGSFAFGQTERPANRRVTLIWIALACLIGGFVMWNAGLLT